MRPKLIRLEELTWLVALKNYQLNTSCRAETLPNEHESFSQCRVKIEGGELFGRRKNQCFKTAFFRVKTIMKKCICFFL